MEASTYGSLNSGEIRIKRYNEFTSMDEGFMDYLRDKFTSIKEWFVDWISGLVGSVKEGARKAAQFLNENPQFLDQLLDSIDGLPEEDKRTLLSLKPLINSFTGSPRETKAILGMNVYESEEKEKVKTTLQKIGEWAGLGASLISMLSGIIISIGGLLDRMPMTAILGFILLFIGAGINSLTGNNY